MVIADEDQAAIALEPEPERSAEDVQNFRRIRLQVSRNLDENRYEFARDFCREMKRTKGSGVVFDVGAGATPMRAHVRAAGHQWRGFDLRPRDPEVEPWDLNQPPPFAERADAVLMLDVIEHLFNVQTALQNIARALKPGGKLVLTMPNPAWSRSRIHLLVRGTLACFTQHDFDWNHHCFTPWPHVLEGLLQESGFRIDEYVTLEGRTRWPRLSPAYPALLVDAVVRKLMEARDKGACGMSYGVVATLN